MQKLECVKEQIFTTKTFLIYAVYIWKYHVPMEWMEWHFSFPLMNSFNKTAAAVFPMQTMLPKDFSFSQIIYTVIIIITIWPLFQVLGDILHLCLHDAITMVTFTVAGSVANQQQARNYAQVDLPLVFKLVFFTAFYIRLWNLKASFKLICKGNNNIKMLKL